MTETEKAIRMRKAEIEIILSDFGLDSEERVEDLIDELQDIKTTLKIEA